MRLDAYSDRDGDTIRRLWTPDYTLAQIAERLGRSVPSIRQKARRLGLGRKEYGGQLKGSQMRRSLHSGTAEAP